MKTGRAKTQSRCNWPAFALAVPLVLAVADAEAHPHVFINGGVDFVLDEDGRLEALNVTWRYDEFETLFALSAFGVGLNDKGALEEQDRQQVVQLHNVWADDFDGSAHLSIDGEPIALEWPTDLDAQLVDGRLEVTFVRHLSTPESVEQREIEVAFYESTYFFAFSITDTPDVLGHPASCDPKVVRYVADPGDSELQATLAQLGLEETPAIANVGALFADRIDLKCE